MASELLIITNDRTYDYKNGNERFLNIGKKRAERIFQEWISADKTIKRKYGMGGRIT